MGKLKIRKVPSIGRMTELILNNLGIVTCKDGLDKAAEILIAYYTKTSTREFLLRSFLGLARTTHYEEDKDRKSISRSHTFKGISKLEDFRSKLVLLSKELAADMERKDGVAGDLITVVFKTTKFELVNKTDRLNTYIWHESEIQHHALRILSENWPFAPVRLLGIRMANLREVGDVKSDRKLGDYFKSTDKQEIKSANDREFEKLR